MEQSRPFRFFQRPNPATISVLLVTAVAVWVVLPYLFWTLLHWSSPHRPTWVGHPGKVVDGQIKCDIDAWLIHNGLIVAPRFIDTFRWWTGTWAGQVPFYRPLTSMLFWSEWKLFGDHELRYGLFSVLLFIAAAYQFARMASDLFIHFKHPQPVVATLVAGLIFLVGLGLLRVQFEINLEVYSLWKNQPDALCACFVFPMIRAYLRAMTPRSSAASASTEPESTPIGRDNGFPLLRSVQRLTSNAQRLPLAALGWYLASCLSKEAAILLPLVLICLEQPELRSDDPARRAAARTRLLTLLLAIPLFLLFRAWRLHDAVGFRYGSNHSVLYRLCSELFSTLSQLAVIGDWPPLILGFTLFGIGGAAAWRASHRGGYARLSLWERLGWIAAALLLLALIALPEYASSSYASHNIEDLFGALLIYFAPDTLTAGLAVAVFLGGARRLLRKQSRLALFTYLWALLIFAPTLASPSPLHRYYLMNAGYALMLAGGLTWWKRLNERVRC